MATKVSEIVVMSILAGVRTRPAQPSRLLRIGTIIVIVLLVNPVPSRATHACASRPQDEIWLVSERHIAGLQPGESPPLETHCYDPGRGWRDADISELVRPASPEQILLVFVHGNRVASGEAACEGRHVYDLLTSQLSEAVSVRYVIWSWPSGKVPGQLRDVRVKAGRTELSGYCLGWFLSQLPRQQRASLIGYSFGARIVSGALHLQGGGQLSGRRLSPADDSGPRARVVMLAAALHSHWLRPGHYHENTLAQTDYLLNLFNSCDPVLKRYPLLYRNSDPEALGYTGLYTGGLDATRTQIEQFDVRNIIGNSHAAMRCLADRYLRDRMQEVLFWKPLQGGSVTGLDPTT